MKNRPILVAAIALLVCYGVHDVQSNPDVQGLRNRLSVVIVLFFGAHLWRELRDAQREEVG